MQSTLQVKTTVLPGGKIEIADTNLQEGETVEVTIRRTRDDAARQSVLDILAKAPGHRQFRTTAEVDAYLREERDS